MTRRNSEGEDSEFVRLRQQPPTHNARDGHFIDTGDQGTFGVVDAPQQIDSGTIRRVRKLPNRISLFDRRFDILVKAIRAAHGCSFQCAEAQLRRWSLSMPDHFQRSRSLGIGISPTPTPTRLPGTPRVEVGTLFETIDVPTASTMQVRSQRRTVMCTPSSRHQTGISTPRSVAGRGPRIRRSALVIGRSLMDASRRLMRPLGSNSHSSFP